MSQGLNEALEKLYLDPYPTKKFRSMVDLLKNIVVVLETVHGAQMCCLDEVIAKLTIKPNAHPENIKNCFVPTTEIYTMMIQKQIPLKFSNIVYKLLFYIIVKLTRCSGEEAPSIIRDFSGLEYCILVYKEFATWDTSRIDKIILMFIKKLIQIMNQFTIADYQGKVPLISIMRVMLTEFGSYPVYSATVITEITSNVKNYYERLVSLGNANIDSSVRETYITYLFILNEIIGGHLMKKNKEEAQTILLSLQEVLSDIEALNHMNPREAYLVRHIVSVIGVSLAA